MFSYFRKWCLPVLTSLEKKKSEPDCCIMVLISSTVRPMYCWLWAELTKTHDKRIRVKKNVFMIPGLMVMAKKPCLLGHLNGIEDFSDDILTGHVFCFGLVG